MENSVKLNKIELRSKFAYSEISNLYKKIYFLLSSEWTDWSVYMYVRASIWRLNYSYSFINSQKMLNYLIIDKTNKQSSFKLHAFHVDSSIRYRWDVWAVREFSQRRY